METSEDNGDAIATIKDLRKQLESRIETQRTSQTDIFSSLQTLVPEIVSSVDLTLKVISFFNHRPFTPTPLPPPNPNLPNRNLKKPLHLAPPLNNNNKPTSKSLPSHDDSTIARRSEPEGTEKFTIDESGNPLTVVRSTVAVCLLQRVPFTAIDSSTVLRKLENDQSATAAEKAALRELGGESGAILAVEMALRSMAEDNGGVDLEEFVVSGKSRVMVLAIDRTRLVKELPESSQQQQQDSGSGDGNQSQKGASSGGAADANGGVYGMGGMIPRPMPDMWLGPGDSNMSGLPPMFPGTGPSGMMMGPRGAAPRVMGMMGMPRGIGVERPQLGNAPINGPNTVPQRMKTEEDELKDLEAMLNKKSFREMQKSKTGEELLDLIHRPTAKETAMAAKVLKRVQAFSKKK